MKFIDFLNRHFEVEYMDGDGLCPLYLVRWELWRGKDRAIYLHRFVGDDWTLDLHDHPKRFISIGLLGQYIEETESGERVYRAPWIRSFPAEHKHRLKLIDKRPCWTLVMVGRTTRRWGFWHNGTWIRWRKYLRSSAAISRRSC